MRPILIVDDEKNYLAILRELLEEEGFAVETARNPFAALDALGRCRFDLVLTDMRMPRMDGLEFMRRSKDLCPEIPFIVMTAYATVETAIEALKLGAFDYLIKPFKNDELLISLRKALEFSRLRRENLDLRARLEAGAGREFIGESPAVSRLLTDVGQVAPARSSVLILGESGTGKELIARQLHRKSPRAAAPLVALNCAAISENLLESELFGHEKGAFTGAVERKRGLLEVADGGTLFLDEIGEFPLALQPKLLRVLQERRFRRVGGTQELEVDVRLLAATHRDLPRMIEEGRFREDLYYRLNVVTLQVPALRERPGDIPLLALHFLQQISRELGRPLDEISKEALARLQSYGWPGNVRELRNAMERGAIFCRGQRLEGGDLPPHIPALEPEAQGADETPGRDLASRVEAFEKGLIRKALIEARGVQAQAAEKLGVSRSNLQYKLKKYDLI